MFPLIDQLLRVDFALRIEVTIVSKYRRAEIGLGVSSRQEGNGRRGRLRRHDGIEVIANVQPLGDREHQVMDSTMIVEAIGAHRHLDARH
jgi:hypothetical protein